MPTQWTVNRRPPSRCRSLQHPKSRTLRLPSDDILGRRGRGGYPPSVRRTTLPHRIWVVGHCGSGKSTVADLLARAQGVEVAHLDDLHWKPGWIEAEPEEEEAALARIVQGPAWVVDGNYGRLRTRHQDRVDLYVWLDLPLSITFPRLVRRCFARSFAKIPCCNGNTESLRLTFFDRESILLWSLRMDGKRRRQLEEQLRERPHIRLRSPAAVDRWLRSVTAAESRGRS